MDNGSSYFDPQSSGGAQGQPMKGSHSGGNLLTAFARKIGWAKTRLNELIKATRGVTAEREQRPSCAG